MMLSTAKSSLQPSKDNAILNNNTLENFKVDESVSSMSESSRHPKVHRTVYREIRPSRAPSVNVANMKAQNSAPTQNSVSPTVTVEDSQIADHSSNPVRTNKTAADDSNGDKVALAEGSTKVAGTWCPPIQALSSQTASLFPEMNGKKVTKVTREVKDNASVARAENVKVNSERIVRAPCVKVEPLSQGSQNSAHFTEMADLKNGVKISRMPLKLEIDSDSTINEESSELKQSVKKGFVSKLNELISVSSSGEVNSLVLAVSPTLTGNLPLTPLVPQLKEGVDGKVSKVSSTPIISQICSSSTTPSVTESAAPTRKPCNCTKSSCLKLYCECFAQGLICSGCNCTNCMNNEKHSEERNRAIKMVLVRNPAAFQSKIERNGHVKGCNCKKSNCLKNYCECYEAKMACTSLCRCLSCQNTDHSHAMEMVRRSVYAKLVNKDPSSQVCYNSPSTSSSVHDSIADSGANQVTSADLKRSANSSKTSVVTVDLSNPAPTMVPTVDLNLSLSQVQVDLTGPPAKRLSLPATMTYSNAPSLTIPFDSAEKVSSAKADISQLINLKLKRMRPYGTVQTRNVVPSTSRDKPERVSAPSENSTRPHRSSDSGCRSASSSDNGGIDSLSQTIEEVVSSYKPSETRRQKTVPYTYNPLSLSLPAATKARFGLGVNADNVPSSPDSSSHLTIPVLEIDEDDDDEAGSSEISGGPREDEFTEEELAMMQRIRQRAVHSTDASTIASNCTIHDGANSTPTAPHTNDESPLTMDQTHNGATDLEEEDGDAAMDIDCADVASGCLSETAASSRRVLPTAAEEQQHTEGSTRRNLAVLPDPETPKNILSFLQTSQQQIESALGAGSDGGGSVAVSLAASSSSSSGSGNSKLLFSILNTSSGSGGGSLASAHLSNTAFRSLCSTAASNSSGSVATGGGSAGSGGVVHWRPQQHPTASPSLPTSHHPQQQSQQQQQQQQSQTHQQQQAQAQQQQQQRPQSPDPSPSPSARSATLSRLTDLVDGENGLRSQVTALERQVSAMRRSQIRQTRLLVAIHRTLMRRQQQQQQTLGSNRWSSASSNSNSNSNANANACIQQPRRRLRRWRKARDSLKDS